MRTVTKADTTLVPITSFVKNRSPVCKWVLTASGLDTGDRDTQRWFTSITHISLSGAPMLQHAIQLNFPQNKKYFGPI